jgi:hypothetical protein
MNAQCYVTNLYSRVARVEDPDPGSGLDPYSIGSVDPNPDPDPGGQK